MMKFIKTRDSAIGAKALLGRIRLELDNGKKVLWLLSGGSAVAIALEILNLLRQTDHTPNLTVMLMDERYGPVGHKDSNWWQLQQAGCDLANIKALPVLTQARQSLADTANDYTNKAATAFESADIAIGLFGLGADGHTAGILPSSPATKNTSGIVTYYETPQYARITLTLDTLKRVNAGYVFAYGTSKNFALTALKTHQLSFNELPAMLLYDLPEVYVYNDQIGETI